jgi:pullulanase
MAIGHLVAVVAMWTLGVVPALAAGSAALERTACDAASFETRLHSSGQTLDARAVWLNRGVVQWPQVAADGQFRLYYSRRGGIVARPGTTVAGADGALDLDVFDGTLPARLAERFRYVEGGVRVAVKKPDLARLADLHRGELVLVHEDGGRVREATRLQIAGALDDLYAAAESATLGATVDARATTFRLWAPTAQRVSLCLFANGASPALASVPMRRDALTGRWFATRPRDLSGLYYLYVVDVFVPGIGLMRNLVTDPYSLSLTTDSRRSYIARLDSAALKPPGWDSAPRPAAATAPTDTVIYELHVRDFSAADATVPREHRGKYLAFTDSGSAGMRHLKSLAAAGLTDVHLLPVFDFASVPERGCIEPMISGHGDSEQPAARLAEIAASDCYNWGYDPFHFSAPEGSYATDAADGARRIVELRAMVAALHRLGLRVGMDVVYNHTVAAGQHRQSVLDRIVPGYYHRLDRLGAVETSTCCANTATENRMMGKLMIDSVIVWARDYRIDSFRFDLMGHQPRAVMEALKARVENAAGRPVQIIGEGWNFGEVADGARFVQASQRSLSGAGIGTFSDRARDAIRGGGPADPGTDLIARQGYVNGLYYDPNALGAQATRADLLKAADLVRTGLAGTLRDYALRTGSGETLRLAALAYAGQPAGYAGAPEEVVNYVENHDNHTLFDINALKLSLGTSREDRARVQVLAAALTAFSQGVAYFHAGVETLRSKSLDRNSYDSGDWFNRIDWTLQDNGFASGAPPGRDNARDWPITRPLLARPEIKPTAADIAWTDAAFHDLLRIRASSTLFRLRTAEDIRRRLTFYNTGPDQEPTVIVGHLDGAGYPGAAFGEAVYLVNVDRIEHAVTIAALAGKTLRLHPVHRAPAAADLRARAAGFDPATGAFQIPARTAVVFVASP